MDLKKPHSLRSKDYKDFVIGMRCTIDNDECQGDIVPAHIGMKQRGTGNKAPDIFCIPLCYIHHMEEHKGTLSFFEHYNTTPLIEVLRTMEKFLEHLYERGIIK